MENTEVLHWPYLPTLYRIALAVALGLFVGLERERRGKEAGVRTFGFTALLGCIGALLGDNYALLVLTLLIIPVIFLNWQRLQTNQTAELTTSAALLVTGLIGVLCGKGHTFTPVVVAVITAALLAWKERLTTFAVGLSEIELRSAILLAILTFVIYPILPVNPIDPWGLIELKATWMTVILIATIGFINYVFWKLYGTRGIEFTGFLGGLVNSTVTATELADRVRESGVSLVPIAYRGVLLATGAMLIRNAVLLGLLAPSVLGVAAWPMGFMLLAVAGLALRRISSDDTEVPTVATLKLESPFSLPAVLKFGLIFLLLRITGTLAQRFLGAFGFYAVSLVGGLVSSSSSVASAATLATHRDIPGHVAANGAVLATLASVIITLPLVARIANQPQFTRELGRATALILFMGVAGLIAQMMFFAIR